MEIFSDQRDCGSRRLGTRVVFFSPTYACRVFLPEIDPLCRWEFTSPRFPPTQGDFYLVAQAAGRPKTPRKTPTSPAGRSSVEKLFSEVSHLYGRRGSRFARNFSQLDPPSSSMEGLSRTDSAGPPTSTNQRVDVFGFLIRRRHGHRLPPPSYALAVPPPSLDLDEESALLYKIYTESKTDSRQNVLQKRFVAVLYATQDPLWRKLPRFFNFAGRTSKTSSSKNLPSAARTARRCPGIVATEARVGASRSPGCESAPLTPVPIQQQNNFDSV